MQIGFNDNSFVSIGKKERAFEILKNDFSKFDTAAGIGPADGKISKQDLTAVLQNATGQYSPEDMAVAKFILNTPDLQTNPGVNMFDAAAGSDGLLTSGELDNHLDEYYQRQAAASLPPPPIQPPPIPPDNNYGYDVNNPTANANQKAIETVQSMLPRLGGGDGVLNRGEALAELNDNTGKYTDEEKAALRYMLTATQNSSGATLWDAVGGADGVVGNIDFEAAKKGNMDPASMQPGSLSPY